jgi:hypothetical protein
MNNAKDYIDSLFSVYEQTRKLADFKEELLGNLNDKIASLVKKGMDGTAAFEKAAAELGDLSVLAEEISLKKKQEVYRDAYMDIKNYMTPLRVLWYVICGLALLFGIITAAIVYFSERQDQGFAGVFGVLLVFIPTAIACFTFLGLTQEMPDRYPMKKKRALLYTLAAALMAFGLILFPLTLVAAGGKDAIIGAIGTLIPFELPGIGLLVFLVLTEKDWLKPWAQERRSATVKREYEMFSDPAMATRFGLFSGAIWIFAVALFLLLGFVIGFKFSWLVFVFAVAVELFVQALLCKPGARAGSDTNRAAG